MPNKSGFITEVEIKISRADYKNDFTKKDRHKHLSGVGVERLKPYSKRERRHYTFDKPIEVLFQGTRKVEGRKWEVSDHTIGCEETERHRSDHIPNYFYYAYPKGLIEYHEVPAYCGILEITEVNYVSGTVYFAKEVRKPRRLHKRKATDKDKYQLLRSQMFRVIKSIQEGRIKEGWD